MTTTLSGCPLPLDRAFDSALIDLDGVVYRGPEAVPSAPAALEAARAAGMTLVFVTNNASREPSEVAAHLTALGVAAKPEEVLTAVQVGVSLLTERLAPGNRVLVVGGPALRNGVVDGGFVVVDSAADHPAAVIQGWHPDVGWRHLAEASYAIQAGAHYFVTNRDSTLPNERGIAPGNGSLVQAVVAATGIEPDSAGKPSPRIFREAAAGVSARHPLVIGDRLDTDIAGARAAGIPALLVLTGVSTARNAILAAPDERPSFIGETLACLSQSHPAPEPKEGWWRVGGAAARVVGESLEIAGTPGIDAVRAACVAAWEAADRGDAVHVESLSKLGIQ